MLIFPCFVSMFSAVSPFVLGASNTVVSNEAELMAAVNNAPSGVSVAIAFNRDITLTGSALTISANKDITLTSTNATKFYKLIGANEQNTIIVVEADGSLLLDGIIVTHRDDANRATGVLVNSGGTFILSDGEISGNHKYGVWNMGNFRLLGGKISENTHYVGKNGPAGGGGVYNQGIFDMLGGEISDNRLEPSYISDFGSGGVYNEGVFNMSGGIISKNNAPFGAGVTNEGYFTLSDGEISGNLEGNGVRNRGNFSMFGGKISDTLERSGVFNGKNGGNFSLSGGEISGNGVSSPYLVMGGGVCNEGVFMMLGGMISNNKAMDGGGVYNGGGDREAAFSMSGGIISGNIAECVEDLFGNGGGVYNDYDCKFSLSEKGVISNNIAEVGGGVYNAGTFNRRGGVISSNNAMQYDNIYPIDDSDNINDNSLTGYVLLVVSIVVVVSVIVGGLFFLFQKNTKPAITKQNPVTTNDG
jgi:hypothetical protein